MITGFSVQQPNRVLVQFTEGVRSKNSLLSRFHFTLNWEKVMRVSNLAFIIAGIAYGFFLNLPWMTIGNMGYGCLYIALSLKAKGENSSNASLSELQSRLHDAEDEGRKINEKIQAFFKDSEYRKQAEQAQKGIEHIASKKKENDLIRKKLLVERAQLQDEVNGLK